MGRDETKRLILKTSTTAGEKPTIPVNEDHRSGLWLSTDIYKGELFSNLADGKLYTRSDNGIEELPTTSSEGTILYKARIHQTLILDPVLTEFINNTGETITVSRTALGTYVVTGFNGQLGTDCTIHFEGNGIPEGASVKIFSATGDDNFVINTYNSSDSLSDSILLQDVPGLFYFNSIIVRKH